MAARYLRRHGDHRARAGRGPGKIQPLWRRVSLTAGTSGGGLGSVAPAARPRPTGPRASTRTLGLPQTPQPLALCHSPALPGTSVRPSHPHSQCPTQGLHNTGSVKPLASRISLHTKSFRVHIVPQIREGPKGPSRRHKRQLLLPPISFRNTPCGVLPASATHTWSGFEPLCSAPTNNILQGWALVGPQSKLSRARGSHTAHTSHMLPTRSRAASLPVCLLAASPLALATNTHHACAQGLAHVNFLEAHFTRTLTSLLAQGPLAAIPTCSSKHTRQSRGAHSPRRAPVGRYQPAHRRADLWW